VASLANCELVTACSNSTDYTTAIGGLQKRITNFTNGTNLTNGANGAQSGRRRDAIYGVSTMAGLTCLYEDTLIRCVQETPAALCNRLSAVHSSLRNASASAR